VPVRDLLLNDYRSLVDQYRSETDPFERLRLKEKIQQAKANLSMSGRLERAGADVSDVLAPVTKPPEKSTLTKIADTMDLAGNWTRKNIVAPVLGVDTTGKEKVYGTDILESLGWKGETPASRFRRGALGFGIEVATDPLTYLSFGTGAGIKAGGKVLSKVGQKAFKEIAESTAREAGEKVPAVIKRAEEQFLAQNAANPEMFARGGVKFAGKRIPVVSDVMEATGRGLKNQWNDLEDLANPVRQTAERDILKDRSIGLKEGIAKVLVPAVHGLGEAVSTKFNLPESYLTRRKLYRTALDRAKFETVDGVKGLYDGLDVLDRKKIALYLDSPEKYAREYESLYGPLSARAQQVADETAARLKKYGQELTDKGLLEGMRENYISHMIGRDLPSHMQAGGGGGGGLSRSLGGAEKERNWDTFGDLFADFPELKNVTQLDASKILANYEWHAKKAMLSKRFLGDVEKNFSRGDLPFQEVMRENLADFSNGRGVTIKNIPTSIARNLYDLDKSQRGATTVVGKMWDALQGGFKKMVTVPFPAFHVRNLGSNNVLNFLDVGVEAMSPLAHAEALALQFGKKNPDELAFAAKNGVKYTNGDVRELAKEYGVLKGETWGMGPVDKAIDFGLGSKIRESNFNIMKWGRKAGGFVEDEGRFFNFVANLKRGLSPEDAARHVDDYLFDYSDLSKVDRQLKRIIPFWSFTRKSAEMHAKTLLTKPGRIGAEFRMGRAGAQALFGGEQVQPDELAGLPEFFQEGLKVVSKTPGKDAFEIVSGLGLPIEDLESNPLLTLLTGGDMMRSITKFGGGRLSPLLKTPIDLVMNKDTFFGTPLEGRQFNKDGTVDYPYTKAYPILKKMPDFVRDWLEFEEIQRPNGTVYRMNPRKMKEFELFSLGMLSRAYGTAGKLTDTKKTTGQKAVDLLTGIKTYSLPDGEQSLQERAAKRRTSQVANLLMGESSDLKYRRGE